MDGVSLIFLVSLFINVKLLFVLLSLLFIFFFIKMKEEMTSFDLGIESDSEDLLLCVVEDSFEEEEVDDFHQNDSEGEVNSQHDVGQVDGVAIKMLDFGQEVEGVTFVANEMFDFEHEIEGVANEMMDFEHEVEDEPKRKDNEEIKKVVDDMLKIYINF